MNRIGYLKLERIEKQYKFCASILYVESIVIHLKASKIIRLKKIKGIKV